MRGLPLVLVALAAIAAPGTLVAQEEDDAPDMLRLSFFMCNSNRIDDAMEEVESQVIPVWNELVAEGMDRRAAQEHTGREHQRSESLK